MRTRRTVFMLVVVCLLATGYLASDEAVRTEPMPAEEYEVYAAALKHMVGGMGYVVIDVTSVHGDVKKLDSVLNFPVEHAKLVTDDLVKDFKQKNQNVYRIEKKFPEQTSVTLLSEQEEHEIFKGFSKGAWEKFYEKYVGASGITRISRVGFNKNHDVAAVYLGNVSGWESGHGAYVLLQKIDGKWKVLAETRGWIA